MKVLCVILLLVMLVMGCGPSAGDIVGVYRLHAQDGTLELKADGTYVQTLKLAGQATEVRSGKWTSGKWHDTGKPTSYFNGGADGTFVYLENANALEACPPCKAVAYQTVQLEVQTGMMNVLLVQDPKSNTVYSK